ncbi:BTAD domain-containing putative transcriptional regulator [Actinoplanes sp. NPDC049681]|uniref:BTAD domain-containing putative transcriptional regulator n=1 Tax=Actinoplanes sp. NPDC049681 TaxID=3363905 RepID=UPI0037A49BCF
MVVGEDVAQRHELHIRLLGPVRAVQDGTPLSLGTLYPRAVFTVLAMNANRPVAREELVNAVWGADPPPSAANNVYTYVSMLRDVLEPQRDRRSSARVLASGGGSYCLRVAERHVDVFRFEALREQARKLRTTGDLDAELLVLESAIDLWQGDALEAIPGPFAETQRRRLGELRLAAAERRAALMLDLGRHQEAIAELRNLVECHPLQENLHGLLMAALYRGGRRTEALEVYCHVSTLLVEQAGTEPGDSLRSLHSRIRDGHVEPAVAGMRAAEPANTEQGPAGGRAPFVGRAAELRLLRRAVSRVAAGRGGSVWLDGEPGSGKSALLAEALRGAGRRGCDVRWGVGDELSRHLPLRLLLECFDLDSEQVPGSARTMMRTLRSVSGELIRDPAATVERALTMVRSAAAAAPLVLVLDDLQWADETTLQVWSLLHRMTGQLPLLLIAAARTVPRRAELDVLHSLVELHGAEVVHLPPLDTADATAMAAALAHEVQSPARVASAVAAAGGNPYYLIHLIETAEGDRDDGAPPPALVAAVERHLDPLTDEVRQVLRALAVLGDGCSVTELSAVTGSTVPDLIHTVGQAQGSGMLTGSVVEPAFRHPIVRQVLYDQMPTALRVLMHGAYAERIAKAGGGAEHVIRQLLAGPTPMGVWGAQWLADHADPLCVRMPEATTEALRRATAQPALTQQLRERLTASLARQLFRRGFPADAEANWVAARTSDPELRAEMCLIIAQLHRRRGAHGQALAVVHAALRSPLTPRPWIARYRGLMAQLLPSGAPDDPAPASERSDTCPRCSTATCG